MSEEQYVDYCLWFLGTHIPSFVAEKNNIAGIAARDDILGDNDKFASGSTFAGTPAGCAAGIKTLEIFERDKIVDQAAHLSDAAADIMSSWEQYDIVRQVRASDLLIGVAFPTGTAGF